MVRLILICVCCASLAACARLAGVINYETSITRVTRDLPDHPAYASTPVSDGNLTRQLAAAGFQSFQRLDATGAVTDWFAPGHGVDRPVRIKSVSKVLASTLIGQAAARGQLDLDARIDRFGPCPVPPAMAPLSHATLLNMRAGFDFVENVSLSVYTQPDWGCAAMDLPVGAPSGTRFNYNTVQYHLAGIDASAQLGADFAELVQGSVLGPMGITLDGWVEAPNGAVFVGSEFLLHPRDMLRFGHVMLNGGAWEGRQIIPQNWIAKTRSPVATDTKRDGISYAWGWWLTQIAGHDVQFAEGYGGQIIFVVPSAGQVIVFSASTGGLVSGATHDARMAAAISIVGQLLRGR